MKAPIVAGCLLLAGVGTPDAQETAPPGSKRKKVAVEPLPFPPALPDGKTILRVESASFLKPPGPLDARVQIAKTPPVVEILYYPGQTYAGKPWTCWARGTFGPDGTHYAAIGDHISPRGRAMILALEPGARDMRPVVDLRSFIESSGIAGDGYVPGKIHTRLGIGRDGWIYYGGHRGSAGGSTDEHGFKGDWIFRTRPDTGATEVVAPHPIEKHTTHVGFLDPERMIFYGRTAAGKHAPIQEEQFFAFDVEGKKLLFKRPASETEGRFFSRSTGCVYWKGAKYDPARNEVLPSGAPYASNAARETDGGIIYGVTDDGATSQDRRGWNPQFWAFDVRTETVTPLGPATINDKKAGLIASLDVDPGGRYLYYVLRAHGKASEDGTPVLQFDVQTRTLKALAFLHPTLAETAGYVPDGTYSCLADPKGEALYITWNGWRKGMTRWETCALTILRIPESERAGGSP